MSQPTPNYCTDLSDGDWERIRPHLQGAEQERAIVNTLRYRDRTGLGWDLLPPDLVAGAEARATEERWRAEGTWQQVQSVLSKRPPGWSPWRARLFEGLRRLKRWAVRVLRQRRKSQGPPSVPPPPPSPPGEEALIWFDRYLRIDPWHAGAYLRRGTILLGLRRYREAIQDGYRALAAPNGTGGAMGVAHFLLARGLLALGDLGRALAHMYQAVRLGRDCPLDQPALSGVLPEDALGLQLWIEAHEELAAEAINTHSDFPTAFALYRAKEKVQEHFLQRFGIGRRTTLYLSADWVRNIGHIALLDFCAKMQHLGWRAWDELVVVAPPEKCANPVYADYWRDHYRVVTDAHLVRLVTPLAEALGPRVAGLLRLPDGREMYFSEGMGAIQEAWEQQGREPLLRLRAEDEEHGRAMLRTAFGVPEDAWFVCLHVRTGGYHQEGANDHQAHRNANIESYRLAIEEITRRGGWVIRLGDATMPPVPALDRVIDYARSRFKSPRLDVFLLAACRFFIGVTSGLSHLPTTFGVPCVLTNWASNALPVYSRLDLFLPKLLRSRQDGRVLTFAEALAPTVRLLNYSGTKMHEAGLAVVDNTPEELREVVEEMFEQLAGAPRHSADDDRYQAIFRELAFRHGLVGFSRVGRGFLRRHAALLPRERDLRQAG